MTVEDVEVLWIESSGCVAKGIKLSPLKPDEWNMRIFKPYWFARWSISARSVEAHEPPHPKVTELAPFGMLPTPEIWRRAGW